MLICQWPILTLKTTILEFISTYQALENISHDEDSLIEPYISDNKDMVEDVNDTIAYDC